MPSTQQNWDNAKGLFAEAAAAAHVDSGILAKIAYFETAHSFNPSARPIATSRPHLNTVRQFDGVMAISSAYGYGQFLDGTWKQMINQYGEKYGVEGASHFNTSQANALRGDTRLQAAMLAEFTRENVEKGQRLGGHNADANVYALHNLGEGDGARFLRALQSNPNQPVNQVLSSRVISGNAALYGNGSISVAQAYEKMGTVMAQGERYAQEVRAMSPHTQSQPQPNVAQPTQAGAQIGAQAAAQAAQQIDRTKDPVQTPNTVVAGIGQIAAQAAHTAEKSMTQKSEPHAEHATAKSHANNGVFDKGDRGEDVKQVQAMLASLGAKIGVDGIYGPETERAVKGYQMMNGLEVDGIVGPKTMAALKEDAQRVGGQSVAAPSQAEERYQGSPDKYMPPQQRAAQEAQPAAVQPTPAEQSAPAAQPLSATAQNLNAQIEAKVREYCNQHGQPWNLGMEQTVAGLAATARESKLTAVEIFSVKDGNIIVAQKDATGFGYVTAQVSAREVANTPVEQSMERLAAVDQQMLAQQSQQPNNPNQTQDRSGPKMV